MRDVKQEMSISRSGEWFSDYVWRGETLFYALPNPFSFDDLLDVADRLTISNTEAIEHLRIMLREELVRLDHVTFRKIRRKAV